jgi:hypothetical protein
MEEKARRVEVPYYKRLHIKFIMWLANQFGYQVVMVKHGNAKTSIQGNRPLLRYVDLVNYLSGKEPGIKGRDIVN